MRFKEMQLWLNQHYNAVRYSIYIVVFLVLVGAYAAVLHNQTLQNAKIEKLSEQNRSLSQDNKTLNKENKDSSLRIETVVLQSREYARCIAELQAKNSRDKVAYTIENLDTCAVRSQNGVENFNPQPGTAAPGGATQPRSGTTSPTQGTPGATGATGPQGSPGVSPAPTPAPTPNPQAIIPLAPSPILPCILGVCLL